MLSPIVDLVITVFSMLTGIIGMLFSFIALRQIKRIDRLEGQGGILIGLGKDVEYMKKTMELQTIEMKGMDKKLTDFIIDQSKGARRKTNR